MWVLKCKTQPTARVALLQLCMVYDYMARNKCVPTLDINVNILHYYYSIIIFQNNICFHLFGYQYYNIGLLWFSKHFKKNFKLTKNK